jgi:DNA polymerase alpha subunit B
MVAAGPFTFKNSLQYQGLLDFLAIARKESPHALLLLGPFVDMSNTEIATGDLHFENQGATCFVSHEELFRDLLNTVQKELQGVRTKVILVPSTKDVHHFEPIPQAPFYERLPPGFTAVPNPCVLQLNEVRVHVINTDVIKDICPNMFAKNMAPAKIDLALKGIFEQRLAYPMYPPNPDTPIEYD